MLKTLKEYVPYLLFTFGILSLLFIGKCVYDQSAKTRIKLGENQTEAALESGKDAVETIGETIGRETETDSITRTNEKAIRDAEGADDKVNSAVRDTGLASLCGRAAYRGRPECVQYANPR